MIGGTQQLLGREEPLARIRASIERADSGARSTVLVSGESGIGKTVLVRAATKAAPLVGWGTCVDEAGSPGHWPWTRALDSIARRLGQERAVAMAGDDAALLATIVPAFVAGPSGQQASAGNRDRVLLMDAVDRWLGRVAAEATAVVVLDDLQWADESSLALLEFVARAPEPARLCLIACYRPEEAPRTLLDRLGRLAAPAEHIELRGLGRAAVTALVQHLAGPLDDAVVDECYRRAGGHPVFTRELALLAVGGATDRVPLVVREAIDGRVRRLPEATQRALQVAAVAGAEIHAGVLARVLAQPIEEVVASLRPAAVAGMVVVEDSRLHFAHDLYRETILVDAGVDRARLHQAIGVALEERRALGDDVSAAELARHFTAAIAVDGATRAGHWALDAAAAERRSLAFTEAAAHLRRWRAAVVDTGAEVDDGQLLDVLLQEADALARAGAVVDGRGLLRMARDVARRTGSSQGLARTALAVADLGAQFSARRDDVVRELEEALQVVEGLDAVLEGRLAAASARELQHSVASDRPAAGPLSERALRLGRAAGDPDTLIACLLARHDVLWTPGTATERSQVAEEIVAVAERAGDDERRAEGLLLLANARLELGSAAFLPALEASLDVMAHLNQPRHRYMVATRRAALALLHGASEAAGLIEDAAALGHRIREPDTDNVRMSQRLELVRAEGQPEELVTFAAAAVAHWVGAPVHAHAVAAGFHARAGDLDGARRHVATVVDLGTWRADRSYLWSVFVRELAVAAVALDDEALSRQLFEDLAPLGSTCGVNGAVVAFAGSHAHAAALLAPALGEEGDALRHQAADTYARLGATGWLAEVTGGVGSAPPTSRRLHRQGRTWDVVFHDERCTVPHVKGMGDLAALLARPNSDVHVLELYGAGDVSGTAGPMADRTALESYRQRLQDLDRDMEEAAGYHDTARLERLQLEREALLSELRRVGRIGGGSRTFANHPAERARKAVAARVRDAIRRLAEDAPALAAHLDRAVVTGLHCRYRGDGGPPWDVAG